MGTLVPGVKCEVLGAWVLAQARETGEVAVDLGAAETALFAQMPWPLRRAEWLAGRRVAKRLLWELHGLEPRRIDVLPQASGAPQVYVDGVVRSDIVLSVSHTRRWAVAAVGACPVGVDACDDVDGARLERIGRRVFSDGEAEALELRGDIKAQAAVWALKEAGLKLRQGGVFDPGAKSVRVLSLSPARVADEAMRVALLRLADAAVAVAVGGS